MLGILLGGLLGAGLWLGLTGARAPRRALRPVPVPPRDASRAK